MRKHGDRQVEHILPIYLVLSLEDRVDMGTWLAPGSDKISKERKCLLCSLETTGAMCSDYLLARERITKRTKFLAEARSAVED